jgi:hypothetical protein
VLLRHPFAVSGTAQVEVALVRGPSLEGKARKT